MAILPVRNLTDLSSETVIVSEEYGRQICPGRLVVQPEVISVRLDDPKAILEAPTKKV